MYDDNVSIHLRICVCTYKYVRLCLRSNLGTNTAVKGRLHAHMQEDTCSAHVSLYNQEFMFGTSNGSKGRGRASNSVVCLSECNPTL